MNLVHNKCPDCGASIFVARRSGFRMLVDWQLPAAGRYVMAMTAGGQPIMTDLGQELAGGYAEHLCPQLKKRLNLMYRRRPLRRAK